MDNGHVMTRVWEEAALYTTRPRDTGTYSRQEMDLLGRTEIWGSSML